MKAMNGMNWFIISCFIRAWRLHCILSETNWSNSTPILLWIDSAWPLLRQSVKRGCLRHRRRKMSRPCSTNGLPDPRCSCCPNALPAWNWRTSRIYPPCGKRRGSTHAYPVSPLTNQNLCSIIKSGCVSPNDCLLRNSKMLTLICQPHQPRGHP